MVVVPEATPVTTPVEPIVATAVLLLLHVPPEDESVNEEVFPAQMEVVPEIGLIANDPMEKINPIRVKINCFIFIFICF